jgi:hypothetical protein
MGDAAIAAAIRAYQEEGGRQRAGTLTEHNNHLKLPRPLPPFQLPEEEGKEKRDPIVLLEPKLEPNDCCCIPRRPTPKKQPSLTSSTSASRAACIEKAAPLPIAPAPAAEGQHNINLDVKLEGIHVTYSTAQRLPRLRTPAVLRGALRSPFNGSRSDASREKPGRLVERHAHQTSSASASAPVGVGSVTNATILHQVGGAAGSGRQQTPTPTSRLRTRFFSVHA